MKHIGRRKYIADIFGTVSKHTITAGVVGNALLLKSFNRGIIGAWVFISTVFTVIGYYVYPKDKEEDK